jgi:hypothetical protein
MIHLQKLGEFVTGHPLTILLCIVVYFMIGMIWYGPLFSKQWTSMNGMTPEMIKNTPKEKMMRGMMTGMTMSIITGFVITVVLGRGMELLDMSSATYPLIIATILWLPFTALPFAQNYAYLQKPFKLWLIDAGYMLVGMWTISLILYKTAL